MNHQNKKRLRRSLFGFLAALFLVLQAMPLTSYASSRVPEDTVSVVDPVSNIDGYSAILYDNTNGLPTSEANAIAETSDGFLWIGGYSGLIRYDGDHFERMDSTTGINSVTCLYVDSQDRLWVGTNESGAALIETGSDLRRWDRKDGLPASSVRGITEDEKGTIYIATTGGISTIGSDMSLRTLDLPELKGTFVSKLDVGADGRLYGLTNSGDVFTLRNGELRSFYSHAALGTDNAGFIYQDPDSPRFVYLEKEDMKLSYGRLDQGFQEIMHYDISPLSQVQYLRKLDGKLWICTRNGIGVLDENGFHNLDRLPLNNSIGSVMSDYEGNLWFTSTRQGVMKIVPNRFTDLFVRYNLSEEVVNSTCLYKDRLLIGTDNGLIVLENGTVADRLPLVKAVTASGEDLGFKDLIDMLDGVRIRSILHDSKGNVWLSTWRKYGLLRFDGKTITAFTVEDGLLSDHVRAISEAKDGSILVALTGGVNVIKDGRITASYTAEDGIINTETLTVAEGTNGDILCGSDGDGIFIINDSGVRQIGRDEGLTSGAIMRIKRDPFRNIYWVISGNSIAYLTEDYQLTTVDTFPYSNNFDIYFNSRDEAWILSSNGIYIVSGNELMENESIDPLHYARTDGLPCIATANSYSELTDDGILYIAGSTGIAKVNIETAYDNVNDLKVAVPYIDVDGERIYPDETGTFTVAPSVRKVTVYPFIYNYSLIDPKVSYRLAGFDPLPVTVERSELVPVDYTNLRGGTYEFTMQLINPVDGSTKDYAVTIVKTKAFYEYIRFYVLSAILVLSAIALFIRWYVARVTARIEKKNREEAQKKQLLSELRMGANIQASMLPSDFPAFPDRQEFDIHASMDPAREVGGDFYDFFLIDSDHLALVMADVSGKGIPAALFMMVVTSILRSVAMLGKSPAEVLTKTNEGICANNQMEMFVTVWMGILEISTGRLTAANAGHEYPAIRRAGGDFELYKDKHGFVIGGMDGIKYKQYELTLQPGDKLFLYTDGVPEATDKDSQLFGTDRMLEALNRGPVDPPQTILSHVRHAVDEFVQDAEQFDDLTMMCIEYKGK